jgi:hypothetical protein
MLREGARRRRGSDEYIRALEPVTDSSEIMDAMTAAGVCRTATICSTSC